MFFVFIAQCLAFLPESILYKLSDILSFILEKIARYRKKTIAKNIALAFPEKGASERAAIARCFYRHLADVVIETMMLSRIRAESLLQRFDIQGVDEVRQVMRQGQSVVLLSAHQGNWEWMLAAVAVSLQYPLDALYRPLHNVHAERFFMAIRTRFCSGMIPADKAGKAILRLRKETRAFGIIGDQNPRRRDRKYWTTFMGVETPVAVGPERIAKMTGYPVFYVAVERVERGRYRCRIEPLAQPPYGEEGDVSQQYMYAVEKQIRQQPECWMWSHHRWRYEKKDCPETAVNF